MKHLIIYHDQRTRHLWCCVSPIIQTTFLLHNLLLHCKWRFNLFYAVNSIHFLIHIHFPYWTWIFHQISFLQRDHFRLIVLWVLPPKSYLVHQILVSIMLSLFIRALMYQLLKHVPPDVLKLFWKPHRAYLYLKNHIFSEYHWSIDKNSKTEHSCRYQVWSAFHKAFYLDNHN